MIPKLPPAKSDIADMADYAGLPLDRIHVITNQREAERAADEILAAGVVGFDTEAKPTFTKGEVSTGPHLVQFATAERAFLFQAHVAEAHPALVALLES